ncbi:hypothetical protein [Engelhardtia mirabilis]|uniref:Uncharacterized protein n=1 Tax=Engelhardtia mirabilis TaxID=2528011 RepID=A0A518BPJ4_9BACT|nr:hypothetical protein Pla133_40170 [Planctomycetes bacterium Pla133]QDV03229.1 hypothetical protein Pla86_40160 [Planctomycetes bacterium Pla86]
MKQIVAVLVFTALAAVAFVVVRKLNEAPPEQAQQQPAGQSTNPKPLAHPPKQSPPSSGSGKSSTLTNQQGQQVTISPMISDKVEALAEVDWVDAAHGDKMVRMADRWEVDLSGVDLEADVVISFEGGEITRDELHQAAVTRLLNPLVEALSAVEIGRGFAASRGVEPRVLSDDLKQFRFELWCEQHGIDVEVGDYVMGLRNGMPGPVARRFYDASGDAVLVGLTSARELNQLSASFLANLPAGEPSKAVEALLANLDDVWSRVSGGESAEDLDLKGLMLTLEQLALLRMDASREDIAKRTWSIFDHELPPNAAMGVATGDLPEGMAPWEAADGVTYIAIDELWPLIEENYRSSALIEVLREYLPYRVLRAELERSGTYADDRADWAHWSAEYVQASGTLLGARFLNMSILGFPNLPYYRGMQRLIRGFERTQEEGWQSEEVLREYYSRNRFLIESWRAIQTMAFFPSILPESQGSEPDFEGALAAAEAMRARVDQGEDFVTLAKDHSMNLLKSYLDARGDDVAKTFAAYFRDGQRSDTVTELGRSIRETYYYRMLNCVSAVYNAVVELRGDEVSQPWRTELGYLLIQMNGASMRALEQEFEDIEVQTRLYHRDVCYQAWANGVIRSTEFTTAGDN